MKVLKGNKQMDAIQVFNSTTIAEIEKELEVTGFLLEFPRPGIFFMVTSRRILYGRIGDYVIKDEYGLFKKIDPKKFKNTYKEI